MTRPLRTTPAAVTLVLLTGCGAAGPHPVTLVGPVTVVRRHSVCVGGADASGACFVKDAPTRDLRVSDCVRVTYTQDEAAAYATPTTVDHLDAATHADDCPRQ